MMTNTQIKKQILKDVEISLDELDIEGMVQNLISSEAVNEAVTRHVQDTLSRIIQEKAFAKIQQQMPIIDAWTNEKVQEFLYSLGIK